MTIKAKLFISSAFEILLVLLVSGFLIFSSNKINSTNLNEARATEIVESISEIRFVTFENLLNHDERSFEQWQLKHLALQTLLEPLPSQSEEERQILGVISGHSRDIAVIFNRLIASYDQPSSEQNLTAQKILQERLVTKQQSQISEALRLVTMERKDTTALRQQTSWLVIGIIFVMLLIMAVNYLFISRSINRALNLLQKGAGKVAEGDFDYRISYDSHDNELGRLAKAFNSMAASLKQIDVVKSEFILLASHQLRTPLTAIKWSSEELISAKNMPPERKEKYIKQIHASTQRMIELVSALLEVSKIDLGIGSMRVKPEKVELSSCLDQVLKDLAAKIHDNKIVIEKSVENNLPHILIDPNWARLIFQNLISNAIKYSPSGQKVYIKLKQQKNKILLEVADRGYGIPAKQQDRVFSKMFRADNAQKLVSDGSGLGLYITKSMVEEAGGTIWFESTENQGTTFYVKLPTIKDL